MEPERFCPDALLPYALPERSDGDDAEPALSTSFNRRSGEASSSHATDEENSLESRISTPVRPSTSPLGKGSKTGSSRRGSFPCWRGREGFAGLTSAVELWKTAVGSDGINGSGWKSGKASATEPGNNWVSREQWVERRVRGVLSRNCCDEGG